MAFDLPPLPYGFDALEPAIDRETMAEHHNRIHQGHVDALNAALASHEELAGKSVEEILRDIDSVPAAIRPAVRFHGGGHANHQFFWKVVQPGGAPAPEGALASAIDRVFGGFDEFRSMILDAGNAHRGSGWLFVVTDKAGEALEIMTLPDEDSVLPLGKPGLIALDLWEHAYFLRHRADRRAYLEAVWGCINWTTIGARLDAIRRGDEKSLGGPAR